MRQFLGLAIGLVVGAIGAVMFSRSLPPEEGSAEERAEKAEHELLQAEQRVAALEAEGRTGGARRTTRDGLRKIAEDIRAGKEVDLDEVFRGAMKPWMRDLAPLFDRLRVKGQKEEFDRLAGQLAREYDLSERQQWRLKEWLDRKAEENADAFARVLENESTGLEDMIRAMEEFEGNRSGIDDFMATLLQGETLARYEADRMAQRVESVQAEADRNVQRFDRVVDLDEDQKDQVFAIMARGADDYDPAMQFEGLEGEATRLIPGQSRNEAVMAILRPDQVEAYEAHRRERREEAEREMREIGLRLPPDWDLWDEDDF